MRSAAQVFCGWRFELRYTDFTVFWEHTGMRKLLPKTVLNLVTDKKGMLKIRKMMGLQWVLMGIKLALDINLLSWQWFLWISPIFEHYFCPNYMGTVRHWQPCCTTTWVRFIGQCYFNPQWTIQQAINNTSCVGNGITHWQNRAIAVCRHMNRGFWRGVGRGGDPFWLHRDALNFKDPAAYQNTAVFQIGVNTKFLKTSTHYATALWVVELFKWLTARPLYGYFGMKGLRITSHFIFR